MLGYSGIKANGIRILYRKQHHLNQKKVFGTKLLENGLHYYPLANNVFVIWLWIIHRVKKPRGTSQHEFSITNCSCKDIMKNICQNDISKTESEPK